MRKHTWIEFRAPLPPFPLAPCRICSWKGFPGPPQAQTRLSISQCVYSESSREHYFTSLFLPCHIQKHGLSHTLSLPLHPPLLGPDVAYFSSYGSLLGGQIKPDIVAPGVNVLSAGSNQKRSVGTSSNATCPVSPPLTLLDSGTSMATPAAAGNAALLRQYFVQGFYPAGWNHNFRGT